MKAAVHEAYGPPEVVTIKEMARPEIGAKEVLVQTFASAVTTADWRMRASAFPGGMWLLGRMMTGLFAPRNTVLGVAFSGRVVSVGAEVTRFKLGDAVYGFSGGGAHAEYVKMAQDGPIVTKPEGIDYAEAATVPFGGVSALIFLRDYAKVKPGQKVLVTGASGAVGVFAVQIARHMGAEVTGVASTGNLELVQGLGAGRVIDYTREDFTCSDARYDLVFDTAGVTRFGRARRILKPDGAFLPLEGGIGTFFHALVRKLLGGKRLLVGVSGDSQADLEEMNALLAQGAVRPVVGATFMLDAIVEAYRVVETRHKRGTVVVTFDAAETGGAAKRA